MDSGLGGACEPTLHRGRVHQTRLLELKIAVSEYGEVRNTLDIVSGSKFRELFRVDLKHDGLARELSRDLCNMRRGHLAWATP
jgi:hypothetical protein